ncbi:MAG: hypothetical protein JNK63_10340 [Chthonomonas sp.]|nr:hypothetical protein [Chthonomonas sp.]
MQTSFTPNIAFGVANMNEAAMFYENVMGFRVTKRHDNYVELDMGGAKLYLVEDSLRVPCLELVANDVDAAGDYLEHHGCSVDEKHSEEAGETIVRDPFGYYWCVSKAN